MASFAKEVNLWLAKCPLKTNGRLANLRLTSLVKEATNLWAANGPTAGHHSVIAVATEVVEYHHVVPGSYGEMLNYSGCRSLTKI